MNGLGKRAYPTSSRTSERANCGPMHPPYQAQLTINRHSAIGDGQWSITNLSSITIIFGKNGSGKSLLLRTLRDAAPADRHYVVPERTGELDYQPNYLQQQIDAEQRRQNSTRNFADQYRRQMVARVQAYFAARGNTRKGQLPGSPEELEAFLAHLLPDFLVELSGTRNLPLAITRSANDQGVGSIDQLSSGEAQLLTMAIDILTIGAIWDIEGRTERLMLIDEPDAHIHPDLQARFADFLVQVSSRYKLQVLLATHSTSLLAAIGQFAGQDASVIYFDRTKWDFRAERFTEVMKELASILGGHALMGPLFGVPLLLVEGDDDYRLWSQVPRHHHVSFSVIPTNGDEIFTYQRRLEQVLNSLRDPSTDVAGYALLDGDKAMPQANPQAPQTHVRFIQLACHESENLYLTDEVLTHLGTNWADVQAKLDAEAGKFGLKEAPLRAVIGAERKDIDLKEVIQQIAQIIDPKHALWTTRVAQVVGRGRPTGQLRQFLGDEVVNALWG